MLRFIRFSALALTAALASGCAATIAVGAHRDPSVDFARYRTYDWGLSDALAGGDPRLDHNPAFKDRFEGTVEKQLARKGLARSESSAHPDLLVHYHATASHRLVPARVGERDRQCYDEDCLEGVTGYEAATIVLDIVDARTHALVWRGWAEDALDDMLSPDKMVSRVDEAVTQMLSLLPASPPRSRS